MALVGAGLFFGTRNVAAQSSESSLTIAGYAWNSVLGWISMRGRVVNGSNETIATYGATIDKVGNDGNITGYVWSSSYGWICWGVTCDPNDTDPDELNNPDYGLVEPTLPDTWHARVVGLFDPAGAGVPCYDNPAQRCFEVDGWAKILKLGDNGWIAMKGIGGGEPFGVIYNATTRQFEGWGWNGGDSGFYVGWVVFSGKTIRNTTGLCTGGSCPSFLNSESVWYTQVIGEWLQSFGGSIFANKGFNAVKDPPRSSTTFNSSHLIQTEKSASVNTGWVGKCASIFADDGCSAALAALQKQGSLLSPKESNAYKNLLGFINKAALTSYKDTNGVDLPLLGGVNRYGYRVVRVTDGNDLKLKLQNNALMDPLLQKGHVIFLFTPGASANLVVDQSIQLSDGDKFGTKKRGTATVVAYGGDIVFKERVLYPPISTSQTTEEKSSLAWLSFKDESTGKGGTITIDDCVPTTPGTIDPVVIAGTMFAEVALDTGTGAGCPGIASKERLPLTIVGSVVTQRVVLDREAVWANQGSEYLKQDGRLTMNTPPGLEDFARQLPAWRNVVP